MAQRIHRRRTKGWRAPEGAVNVGRGTKWGNPYVVGRCIDPQWWRVYSHPSRDDVGPPFLSKAAATTYAVACYRVRANRNAGTIRAELAGRDLMCWCPLNQPCHADVLLAIANGGA